MKKVAFFTTTTRYQPAPVEKAKVFWPTKMRHFGKNCLDNFFAAMMHFWQLRKNRKFWEDVAAAHGDQISL
jgi:hypothetical protein